MDTKVCTGCGETKEATTEFWHKSKTGKYGLRANCKVCINKRPIAATGMKICTGCGIEKPATVEFFHKKKGRKYGLHSMCKVCRNKPIVLVYEFPASKVCNCCGIEKPATAEFFHKQERGKYGLIPKCKVCQAEYRAKPEVKQRANERNKERRKTDIQFKLVRNLRSRLHNALKRNTKSDSTLKLLGCTVEYLQNYLEGFFTNEMTWDNHGDYWVIDHIVACRSFDLSIESEQKSCFHYLNVQPLEKPLNESLQDKEKPDGGY